MKQSIRPKSEMPKSAETDFGVRPEKSEFVDRLKDAVKNGGGNAEICAKTGIALRTLSNWLTGPSEPKLAQAAMLAEACAVDLDWLATGEGAMPRPYVMTADDIKGISTGRDRSADAPMPHGYALIPRYNIEASAGPGALANEENIVDYLAFQEDWVRRTLHADPAKLVLITAIGDSMEPTIRSADLLLVDTGINDFIDDAIYAVGIDDHLVVKRIQSFKGGAVTIRSDNSTAYVDQTLSPEEAGDIRVAGRVRWIGRLV